MDDNTIVQDSYLDMQNCGVSRNDVDVKLEFGLWKTGLTCPDEIIWYEQGADFVLSEREGEIKVNREDSDGSTSGYKRTTSGLVEHTRSLTLKPTWGSRLYQAFANIQIRDSQEGYEGRLFQIYSDGGFHMRITISALDGSYSFQEVALNVKCETFIDTFFTDIASGEAEVELSLMVEFSPIYVLKGELKAATMKSGIEYMTFLADWYTENSQNGIGFFQIGGGIAGDFPICVVPMLYQDMEREDTPFWSYFCQISDSTTSYGSYSGAVPNEKITWGKLDIETPKYIIESDATIVAPLIFAYLLNM